MPVYEITLVFIEESYQNAGYSVSNPGSFYGVGACLESLVTRVCMLVLANEVWFPKDFERDPVCVAEYHYAYALGKKITVDKRQLLL
ncbi:hypothetical protein Xhom_04716 [Xenorhabdus hominickii]|uniref:Uncharacterized protein n=2 Tax=Xenorhabdus hominickii TaxID=351679 RepID=A0A1V0M4Q0_XENHO|nr:hypothetical protein [Xenorhabdus hominickii]PHM51877.1 hypothetical protein Xhom_04716 [Xenorhabdus hominickii]